MVPLNLNIPEELDKALEDRKRKTGVSKAGIAKSAIADELGVCENEN